MKTDNELIAEFMEYEIRNHGLVVKRHGEISWRYCKFETSWDWLMPVVEKIETLTNPEYSSREFIVTIEALYCVISENGENPVEECQSHETKIENVYSCVVKFIKWYNETKQSL